MANDPFLAGIASNSYDKLMPELNQMSNMAYHLAQTQKMGQAQREMQNYAQQLSDPNVQQGLQSMFGQYTPMIMPLIKTNPQYLKDLIDMKKHQVTEGGVYSTSPFSPVVLEALNSKLSPDQKQIVTGFRGQGIQGQLGVPQNIPLSFQGKEKQPLEDIKEWMKLTPEQKAAALEYFGAKRTPVDPEMRDLNKEKKKNEIQAGDDAEIKRRFILEFGAMPATNPMGGTTWPTDRYTGKDMTPEDFNKHIARITGGVQKERGRGATPTGDKSYKAYMTNTR
jgi:hypothetical protein